MSDDDAWWEQTFGKASVDQRIEQLSRQLERERTRLHKLGRAHNDLSRRVNRAKAAIRRLFAAVYFLLVGAVGIAIWTQTEGWETYVSFAGWTIIALVIGKEFENGIDAI